MRSDGRRASVTLLAPSGKDGLTALLARDMHKASAMTLGATEWQQPVAEEVAATDRIGLIHSAVVGQIVSGV